MTITQKQIDQVRIYLGRAFEELIRLNKQLDQVEKELLTPAKAGSEAE
jgi:hypothetical protein